MKDYAFRIMKVDTGILAGFQGGLSYYKSTRQLITIRNMLL